MTAAALRAGARLDAELVRRGLARSRQRAVELVGAGSVVVGGAVARKPSQHVTAQDDIRVAGGREYVSRAAHKLLGALDDVDRLAPGALDVTGARCLDAGASTGGFTEVLLERGAGHVVAVDVGHDQLDPVLRRDTRVTVVERCNVRDHDALAVAAGTPRPRLVVADLSFISLTLVADALTGVVHPGGDLLVMVKPQFEVGREHLASDGVVTDTRRQVDAVVSVAEAFARAGATVRAVLPSVLPGEKGNREVFLWLGAEDQGTPSSVTTGSDAGTAVRAAVETALTCGGPVPVGAEEAGT